MQKKTNNKTLEISVILKRSEESTPYEEDPSASPQDDIPERAIAAGA